MDNLLNQNPASRGQTGAENALWQYVQSLAPETVAQLSQPASQDALQMMERQVSTMLGSLPSEDFAVMVTTSRENLGRLVASAMLSGYFLKGVEQRMAFEQALANVADTHDAT